MPTLVREIDAAVEAYEAARAGGDADLQDFLPPAEDPHFAAIAIELIRVDLEYAWAGEQRRLVEDYRELFPELFQARDRLAQVAYEEYRIRSAQGEAIDAREYERRLGIDTSHWPSAGVEVGSLFATRHSSFGELRGADPHYARTLEEAEHAFPKPGDCVWDFELIEELGRGAFGRVYAAKQRGLASRLVALKITAGVSDEPQQLAQLQHTNIVPIYSMHTEGLLQGICMPLLGRTSLDHLLVSLRGRKTLPATGRELISTIGCQQSPTTPAADVEVKVAVEVETPSDHAANQRSFVEYVAWLGSKLAEGLAHAHGRGVVHCDLKPANVLLADDGQPLILDFNVARSKHRHSGAAGLIGGTLPYMSPEQMLAFQTGGEIEPASDIYALGVILFELLAGRHPFPLRSGPLEQVLRESIGDRQQTRLSLRQHNAAVSPGLEAIVLKCLAPQPEQRYAQAAHLADDLARHLEYRPLKHVREPSWRERAVKWCRRHPRLASTTTVGLLAAVVLLVGAVVWSAREDHLATLEAQDHWAHVQNTMPILWASAEPQTEGTRFRGEFDERSRAILSYYQVDAQDWQRRPAFAKLNADQQRHLVEDLRMIAYLRGAQGEKSAAVEIASLGDANIVNKRLEATRLIQDRKYSAALELLEPLAQVHPDDVAVLLQLGNCHRALGELSAAEGYYTACIALRPDLAFPRFFRGLLHLETKRFAAAEEDFSRVIELDGDAPAAYINRGLAARGRGDHRAASNNFQKAIDCGSEQARVWLLLATSLEALGNSAGAAAAREKWQKSTPTDTVSWLARGVERASAHPAAAAKDFQQVLSLDPHSREALQNLAHILAERQDQPREAISLLSKAIEDQPRDAILLASRGVLHARLGEDVAAIADARAALESPTAAPFTWYQVGCIHALLIAKNPSHTQPALDALEKAAAAQPSLAAAFAADPDLRMLAGNQRLQDIIALGRRLQKTP
jgi:tetratricopeptide (TPR) repeat protein